MQRTFRLALLQHGHIQRIYAKTGVVHHEAAGKSVPTGFGDGVRMMRWVVSEQRHSG